MSPKLRLVLILLLPLFLHAAPGEEYSVFVHGARADGRTVSTGAIQRTIDAAAAEGGGTVVFPGGTYLTGALFLASGVELRLDEGVVLRAVREDTAYPALPTRVGGIDMDWPAALLNVRGCRGVRITGPGVLDGQGDHWWARYAGADGRGGLLAEHRARGLAWAADYDCGRVRGLLIHDSSEVVVEGLTILRPGAGALVVNTSEAVQVRGLVVRANEGGRGPGTTGVEIDSSRDVLVEGCDLDCNDDAIRLSAGRAAEGLRTKRATERVVIRDCVARNGNGLLVFADAAAGIRQVEASGLRAVGTAHGLLVRSARGRGGVVEQVQLSQVRLEGVAKPLCIELSWDSELGAPALPAGLEATAVPPHWKALLQPIDSSSRGIPLVRRVKISDLQAKGAEVALWVNGHREKPVAEFELEKILIGARTAGRLKSASLWQMRGVQLLLDQVPQRVLYEGCYDVPQPELFEAQR